MAEFDEIMADDAAFATVGTAAGKASAITAANAAERPSQTMRWNPEPVVVL